jgi:hypothetical protein
MEKNSFPPLNGNQKRTIEATLWIVDEALCAFEELARGRQIRSVFYSETNDLRPEQ